MAIKHAKYLAVAPFNIFLATSIIKALAFDEPSDTNGIFALIVFIIGICYNLYCLFIFAFVYRNKEEKCSIEYAFAAIILLPFVILLYLFYT